MLIALLLSISNSGKECTGTFARRHIFVKPTYAKFEFGLALIFYIGHLVSILQHYIVQIKRIYCDFFLN